MSAASSTGKGIPGKRIQQSGQGEETIIRTVCHELDGGYCGMLAHVKDGVLIKVEPAEFPEPGYRHICAKGLCTPRWVYHQDRLKYPMKRIGERGSGNWQRISWDEALDTIANRFKDISERYGSTSVAWVCQAGIPLCGFAAQRLAGAFNGTFISYGGPGDDAAPTADLVSFGVPISFFEEGGYLALFENTKLCVSWGLNPAETAKRLYLRIRDAKERGARFVVIDPRFTATAAKADEYIPIRPGTDAALALAMINVIISKGLQDESFVSRYSVGPFLVRGDNGLFLRGQDIGKQTDAYIVWDTKTGSPQEHDGTALVPALRGSYTVSGIKCKPAFQLLAELAAQYPLEKASEITGIAIDTIRRLAINYATCKPVVSLRGWGTQRTFHGDLSHRAIITLATITGNVSLEGPHHFLPNWLEVMNAGGRVATQLPLLNAYEAILTGKLYPIKALWTGGLNVVNQFPNANKIVKELFPCLEFIVVVDMFMTATAEQADILLPVCSFLECIDLVVPFTIPYLQLQQKVIEPLYESKPDLEIVTALAKRLGLGEYFNKSAEEFLEMLLSSDHPSMKGITLEKLKKGPVRVSPYSSPAFTTPSGRIEFYSERLREFGEELSVYKEPLESARRPLAQRYPLSFLQTHTRNRLHSQFVNIDWLRELDPGPMLEMNPADAEQRGIVDGDMVVVFNDRGRLRVKVKVHQGIKPGVVNINQGWWPKDFAEGSHQVLTHDAINPAQQATFEPNVAFYDVLVEVQKAKEG